MTEKTTGRRRRREKNYVQIENAMFQDKRISYKAKGILGYLLTKPDGWVVRMADIINHSTDGDKSTRTGIKELRQKGYLKIFRIKRPDGKFGGTIWEYDDIPFFEFQSLSLESKIVPYEEENNKEIAINEPDAYFGDMDENVDTKDFPPDACFGNVDEVPAENEHVQNHTHISNKDSSNTYSNKTTTNKTKKTLVSISSSSDEILKIDKTFQELYKDAPLEEIKQKLFEDAESGKVKMKTEAQYMALFAKRIQFYLDTQSNTPTTAETGQFGEFATGLGQIPIEERSRQFKAFLSRTSELPNSEPNSEADSEPSSEVSTDSKPNSETLETQLSVLTDPEKTPEEIAEAKKEIKRLMDEIRNGQK